MILSKKLFKSQWDSHSLCIKKGTMLWAKKNVHRDGKLDSCHYQGFPRAMGPPPVEEMGGSGGGSAGALREDKNRIPGFIPVRHFL